MFQRYTEPARRAIFFARYEASQFGSRTIDTHHLLLGILRGDLSIAARRVSPDTIASLRQEIESRVPAVKEKVSTHMDLPLTESSKHILAYANEESELLGHHHIGTEHLLLGILREDGCLAQEVLFERGLRLEAIREELARGTASAQEPPPTFSLERHPLHTVLATHEFTVPLQHLEQALIAQAQGAIRDAQMKLLQFIESLAGAVAQGTRVDDVLLAIRGFHSGLPDEEDWKYRFELTLLLGELLVARYERRTKT
jgi:hypothetical protein